MAAGGGAAGNEHLLARHHHLHRAAGLLGHEDRHRLQEHGGLAAEAAADLGGNGLDARRGDAELPGGQIADGEVALAGHPQQDVAVLAPAGDAGVRFDVALVDGSAVELVLDDDVGGGETRLDVAGVEHVGVGDVGGRRRFVAVGAQLGVDDHLALRGLPHVGDVRQHLVVDLYQVERLVGDGGRGGRHRGDRLALVAHVAAAHHHLRAHLVGDRGWKVVAGHHREHAVERRRGAGVDRADAGVGVRAAQHFAVQHARQVEVGAVVGAPGHLVDAVVTHGARAQYLVCRSVRIAHLFSSEDVRRRLPIAASACRQGRRNRGRSTTVPFAPARTRSHPPSPLRHGPTSSWWRPINSGPDSRRPRERWFRSWASRCRGRRTWTALPQRQRGRAARGQHGRIVGWRSAFFDFDSDFDSDGTTEQGEWPVLLARFILASAWSRPPPTAVIPRLTRNPALPEWSLPRRAGC